VRCRNGIFFDSFFFDTSGESNTISELSNTGLILTSTALATALNDIKGTEFPNKIQLLNIIPGAARGWVGMGLTSVVMISDASGGPGVTESLS